MPDYRTLIGDMVPPPPFLHRNVTLNAMFFDADPQTLTERAHGAAHRPWLSGDAEEWMADTADHRASLYQEAAELTLDTSSTSPEEAAALIVERLSLPSAG